MAPLLALNLRDLVANLPFEERGPRSVAALGLVALFDRALGLAFLADGPWPERLVMSAVNNRIELIDGKCRNPALTALTAILGVEDDDLIDDVEAGRPDPLLVTHRSGDFVDALRCNAHTILLSFLF